MFSIDLKVKYIFNALISPGIGLFQEFYFTCIRNRKIKPCSAATSLSLNTALLKELVSNDHDWLTGRVKFQKYFVNFFNNKTCFHCLFRCPNIILPCQHSFCYECATYISKNSDSVEVNDCPLCGSCNWNYHIPLHPPESGLRILTLDGGGVRGIIELEVLRCLQTTIGVDIPIQSYFDLIVGTSTGNLQLHFCYRQLN